MIWIARLAAALAGLFSLAMGALSVAAPHRLSEVIGLTSTSALGHNSLRADIGTFFLASAIACALALFARQPRWLYGAALLYGLAAVLRIVGILMDGAPEGIVQPILIEVILTGLLVFAARALSAAR